MGNDTMIQLSYISSVSHPLSTEELVDLLQKCLTNNQRDGVTGMLLYGNDTFLQTLEGEEETVDRLYEKILQDPLHSHVKSLTRKTIENRQYSDWSMGFNRISDEELTHVDGLIDFSKKKFTFKYLAEHVDDARRLMDHFSLWDPLLRKVEEKEEAVKHLKTMLAHARGCVEIATLVLQSVAAAGKVGPLEDEHLRVCDVALNALRQVTEMQAQADAVVAGS
jgi:hypothetical protein